MKFYRWPSSEELVVLLISSMLGNKGFEDDTNYYHILSFQIFVPFLWWISHIIYPLPVDLGPPFVDHVGYFSSAYPISRLPKTSVSCSD